MAEGRGSKIEDGESGGAGAPRGGGDAREGRRCNKLYGRVSLE